MVHQIDGLVDLNKTAGATRNATGPGSPQFPDPGAAGNKQPDTGF